MSKNDSITIRWELTDCFIAIPIGNVKCWLQKSSSLILMINSRWFMLYGLHHFTAAAIGKILQYLSAKSIMNKKPWLVIVKCWVSQSLTSLRAEKSMKTRTCGKAAFIFNIFLPFKDVSNNFPKNEIITINRKIKGYFLLQKI